MQLQANREVHGGAARRGGRCCVQNSKNPNSLYLPPEYIRSLSTITTIPTKYSCYSKLNRNLLHLKSINNVL